MGITKYYKAAGQVRVNLPIKWEPDIENAKAQNRNIFNLIGIWFGFQDLEVKYFHAFIDGVDFVFIDAPLFWHRQCDIYGGNRQVKLLPCFITIHFHCTGYLRSSQSAFNWNSIPHLLQEIMKRMILFCKVAVEVLSRELFWSTILENSEFYTYQYSLSYANPNPAKCQIIVLLGALLLHQWMLFYYLDSPYCSW